MPSFEFVKSSYSEGKAGQECVEVARNIPHTVAVRDAKNPAGPILTPGHLTWARSAGHLARTDLNCRKLTTW